MLKATGNGRFGIQYTIYILDGRRLIGEVIFPICWQGLTTANFQTMFWGRHATKSFRVRVLLSIGGSKSLKK